MVQLWHVGGVCVSVLLLASCTAQGSWGWRRAGHPLSFSSEQRAQLGQGRKDGTAI